jgi:Spy/CpxP family protein refolding chaperone
MNRRQMVILPGVAALAATRGFGQTQQPATATAVRSGATSHKALAHYSRLKSFSSIPKTEAKQAKYISFLSTHLSLMANQQAQVASIFAAASASDAELKQSMKTTRRNLGESVMNNDSAGISRLSAAIGTLVAQRHVNGANANAAFFQLLTADQQAKLGQLRS